MEKRVFSVPPVTDKATLALMGAILVVTLPAMLLPFFVGRNGEVVWVGVLSVALVVPLLAWVLHGMRCSTIVLTSDKLTVQGAFGTAFDRSSLIAGEARLIHLRETEEWKPVLKMFGGSLLEYNAGWFVLKNGKTAFLTLTSTREPVVLIPRRDSSPVLLSVDDPELFLAYLKNIA